MGKRGSIKIVFFIGIVWIVLSSILLIGCGGGGGDATQVEPTEPATKEQLLQAIETTAKVLEQEASRGLALEKLSLANQLAIIFDATGLQVIPKDAQNECITVDTRDATTLLTFDGSAQCNGYSGKLGVTPGEGNDPDRDIFVNEIKMIDFATGDGCALSGNVSSRITLNGQRYTDDCTYDNLDVCGEQISGLVKFSGDNWETDTSALNSRLYTFDQGGSVKVDVVWLIDTRSLNGESLFTLNDDSLHLQVDNIVFNEDCNLPSAGKIIIKDQNADNTVVDFTNTSCEDPIVVVDYNDTIEYWELTAVSDPDPEAEPQPQPEPDPDVNQIGQGVRITGKEETIFDWSEDKCNNEDIPDFKARAFRDANGEVQLISTHFNNRRMIGDSLDSLKRDCRVVMSSDLNKDPSKFNDHEWLSATYTHDGQTIYALVINEYYGWQYDGQCYSGEKRNCWYNAVTLAVSNDGGASYHHASPPNHLVASTPYRYVPDNSPFGYLGGTNIIRNDKDQWYYNFLHVEEYGAQKKGVCLMRTKDLSDPESWRAWDGSGFNVRFINPYEETNVKPADHVCEPVSFGSINTTNGHVTYNTFFNKFMLVGAGRKWDSNRKEAVPGFYYSLSSDLINWSQLRLIKEVELWYTAGNNVDRYGYASMIDPSDSSRNFSNSGKTPYLYYIRWNKNSDYNRDLVRVRLEFSNN